MTNSTEMSITFYKSYVIKAHSFGHLLAEIRGLFSQIRAAYGISTFIEQIELRSIGIMTLPMLSIIYFVISYLLKPIALNQNTLG